MKVCALCGKEVEIDRFFGRKAVCAGCGGDLHICLNCRFYSESSHNKCREPKAEFQRLRDKANFCDYFQYQEGPAGREASPGAGDVKKQFDDLFR
ncbi:MAG: hypothetical protein P8Y66_12310 [Nitrospirota bacterium]|jgi:hypothetical protein